MVLPGTRGRAPGRRERMGTGLNSYLFGPDGVFVPVVGGGLLVPPGGGNGGGLFVPPRGGGGGVLVPMMGGGLFVQTGGRFVPVIGGGVFVKTGGVLVPIMGGMGGLFVPVEGGGLLVPPGGGGGGVLVRVIGGGLFVWGAVVVPPEPEPGRGVMASTEAQTAMPAMMATANLVSVFIRLLCFWSCLAGRFEF